MNESTNTEKPQWREPSEWLLHRISSTERLKCLKCGNIKDIGDGCPNCGSDGRYWAKYSDREWIKGVYWRCYPHRQEGIWCVKCDRGFDDWACTKCSCINPVGRTLETCRPEPIPEKKGSCFIATACTGYNSWEVQELSKFRDEWLNSNVIGREVILIYETLSPHLVKIITSRMIIQKVLRSFIILPAAYAAYRFNKKAYQIAQADRKG